VIVIVIVLMIMIMIMIVRTWRRSRRGSSPSSRGMMMMVLPRRRRWRVMEDDVKERSRDDGLHERKHSHPRAMNERVAKARTKHRRDRDDAEREDRWLRTSATRTHDPPNRKTFGYAMKNHGETEKLRAMRVLFVPSSSSAASACVLREC
jgi:hypothetical protein